MGKLNILHQKSWHVYSQANRSRVRRDTEQAQGGASDVTETQELRKPAFRAETPWYTKPKDTSSLHKSSQLRAGDPLLEIRAHNERVDRRRRKIKDISDSVAGSNDQQRHKKKHKKHKKPDILDAEHSTQPPHKKKQK
ncbi:hypothetical protein LPJ77_001221 [Coemansia sp. RSA 2523]|nr:hypothetical protein LPJ54_000780 [Coemansia sp. RSA 1824]KAJ1810026.1 hypothetical protein LPJ77_001221 [Coemansia sp. RSA 2523]KAJ2121312.1 hypothetical protein GGF48_004125 [Coemansia sp. RSA 921]KAJ2133705.1 hypothetical protein GGH17_003136 [Coemansia sp. RSA 788]KAJ2182548.1 hypothetical protein GGF45_000741 [Coemansia sp. RSA 551]KAJ2242885.1 hypothetical protein GGH97_003756 [Coemansia sp. RSA 475]KAJ2265524.1 hypothetical protein EV176_005908 [Coemansia sp. RSA 451]KAJ2269799.1 h